MRFSTYVDWQGIRGYVVDGTEEAFRYIMIGTREERGAIKKVCDCYSKERVFFSVCYGFQSNRICVRPHTSHKWQLVWVTDNPSPPMTERHDQKPFLVRVTYPWPENFKLSLANFLRGPTKYNECDELECPRCWCNWIKWDNNFISIEPTIWRRHSLRVPCRRVLLAEISCESLWSSSLETLSMAINISSAMDFQLAGKHFKSIHW